MGSTWNAGQTAAPAFPYQSGGYYFTSPPGANSTSVALGNGTLRVAPWALSAAQTLLVIGGETTVVGDPGCTIRLGVYSALANGQPGTLILDAGTIPGDAIAVTDIPINLALAASSYFFGGVVQGVTVTQPTVRTGPSTLYTPVKIGTVTPTAGQSGNGYQMTGVTGALPATFVSAGIASGIPRIHVKIA